MDVLQVEADFETVWQKTLKEHPKGAKEFLIHVVNRYAKHFESVMSKSSEEEEKEKNGIKLALLHDWAGKHLAEFE